MARIHHALRAAAGQVGGWTPAEWFQSGENGLWYDLSDLSTLFQDEAGTVSVTADSDPIRYIADKSGNGNHFVIPDTSDALTYRTDGAYQWAKFNGTSNAGSVSNALPTGFDYLTMVAGFTFDQSDLYHAQRPYGVGALSANAVHPAPDETLRFNDGSFAWSSGSFTNGTKYVRTTQSDNHVYSERLNGSEVLPPTDRSGEPDRNGDFLIGLTTTGNYVEMSIYQMVVVDSFNSEADAESFIADKTGVTL